MVFKSGKEENMARQSLRIAPKTVLGRWSIGLIIAMPILFIIGSSFTNSLYKYIPAGETIPADIAVRPALALIMLAGMGTGISAFITGLIARIGQKDNALLVYISTTIGALLILFLAGEIIFPH
jgi:Na+/melibiose symporter-like transporter